MNKIFRNSDKITRVTFMWTNFCFDWSHAAEVIHRPHIKIPP